jgi:uncharacterized membrane-anchored protein
MAVDYSSLLTDEQKKSILEQRLAQFAAEAYQHTLNKEVAKDNEEAVKAADDALAILDNAITVHQSELAKLASE